MVDKTVVLEIDLLKNENRNEFSYIDLVHSELGFNNVLDAPAQTEDAHLVELAKSFEKKYGNMVTVTNKGKRRRLRVDDFIDLGEGYDSQDSFIDDSEAVELVVAPTLRTRHGGFFVNEGFLESIEERSMDIEPPPSVPKQPKIDLSSNTKRSYLKKEKSKQLLERAVKQLAAPAVIAASTGNKTTKNGLTSLDAVFDSVLSASTQNEATKPTFPILSEKVPSNNGTTTPKTPGKQQHHQNSQSLPPLSEDLRAEVEKILAFKPDSTNGTLKSPLPPQFDNELLRFDELMIKKSLSKMTKSAVYAHIAGQFGMKSKTLVGRLRKLKELKDDSLLEPMLIALKDAVSKVMPDILSAYNRDLANYQDRLSVWENEKLKNPEAKRPGAPKKIFRWNSDCRTLVERIVAFRMEATFSATGKCHDEDQMKRFLHSLISLWPDNWISVAALWRAGSSTYQSMLNKLMPGTIPAVTPSAPNSSKTVSTAVSKPTGTVSTSSPSNKVSTTTATTTAQAAANRPLVTSKPSAPVSTAGTLRAAQSALNPVLATSAAPNTRYVSTTNPQQVLTSLVGGPPSGSGGKEAGIYMVKFATPQLPAATTATTTTTTKKEAPKAAVVAPLIDLTEGQQDSPPLPQPLPSASTTPSVNFSPSGIASKAVPPVVTARRIACGSHNATSPVSATVTPAVRASIPSVTVSMGQLLGRTAISASQQQQQQQRQTNLTLQAVSNIITAFQQQQQQNLQKQRPIVHENVRYTAAAAPIIMNRQHQQHLSAPQVNTRPPPGTSTHTWNTAASQISGASASASSSIFPTPVVQTAQASRPHPQQLQQQMRTTFANYNKPTESYVSWSRQYNLTQGQSNDAHRTADKTNK